MSLSFLRGGLLLLPALLCQCRSAPPAPAPAPTPAALRQWHRAASRLAAANPSDHAGRPLHWRFSLRDSSSVNAQSWPDGRIELTSGTLAFARNEAELAAVAAHEMAHVCAHHGRAQALDSWASLLGGAALGVLLAQQNHPVPAAAAASGTVFTFSLTALTARQRQREFAADLASLDLLRRAHYSPDAAVQFWQRYAAARSRQGLGGRHWWKPHPPDAERLRRLRQAAARPTPSS